MTSVSDEDLYETVHGHPSSRSVLYVDMAYTHAIVELKGHHNFYFTRHSSGYFKKVWGVHPISDVAGSGAKKIETYRFSINQTIIEGVSQSRDWPKLFAPVDFFLSQAKLLRQIVSIIRNQDIALIVATDPFYSGGFGLVLKWLTGRPLGIGVYANYDDMYRNYGTLAVPRLLRWFWLQTLIGRFVLRRADLILGGTDYYLNWAIAHGGSRQRGAVIPIARNIEPCHLADPASREPAGMLLASLGVPAGRLMILISRLIPVKFAKDGVRAMIEAARIDPKAVGIVAGDGPMRPELEALVAGAGLTDRIRFVGHLSQEQLSRLLPHCVTISPLTGMALVEAGLGGSPAVAYDADWQPEFVEDGLNGFIVPLHDWQAMGRRAAQLLGDETLRGRMSAAMRVSALARANRKAIACHEHDVFDAVLGRDV